MPLDPIRLRRWAAGVACAAIAATGAGVAALPAAAAPAAPEVVPICPAATPNGRFVRWIYLNILFRCPDAGGATYWTAQLDAGMHRDVFADIIDMSDENLINNNVLGFYGDGMHAILHRAPTQQEIANGVAMIRADHGDARLTATLASSDEFYNGSAMGSNAAEKDQAWLNIAYNGILDRDPDPGGRAYFTGLLGTPSTASSRFLVAMIMEHSGENADSWTGAVFFAGLNRPPDPGGFAYWKNWLMGPGNWQTFRMWTLILSSQEAYNMAQTQPNPPPEESAPAQRALGAWG